MSYLLALLALLLGGGSLALLAVFLVFGPPGWIEFDLSPGALLAWDAGLALAFCLQHSLMVRRFFRRQVETLAGPRRYGALYAIASGLVLAAMLVLWQESPVVVLSLGTPGRWLAGGATLLVLAGFLWGVQALRGVDLLGIAGLLSRRSAVPTTGLKIRGPYRFVRHPMYTLTLVLLWSRPAPTADRLLLNAIWSVWIVAGSLLEERDLVHEFGDAYSAYRRKVPMLLPWRRPWPGNCPCPSNRA